MPKARANGLELEYERFGADDAPAVILIMGIGQQLIRWPVSFADGLADAGYRFIRFDNRDIGLSEKLPHFGIPKVTEIFQRALAGLPVEAAYNLHDMACDVAGLMDALRIDAAHIMGESMGGMIAQVFAADYGARTKSLVSVMSTSSRRGLPTAAPEALEVLFKRAQNLDDLDEIIRLATKSRQVLAGPAFDPGEAYHRAQAERAYHRSTYPQGFARHFAAIAATGSREDLLQRIERPTLVVHGSNDLLFRPACGEDVAALVPGAEWRLIEGMGHAVEPDLVPLMLETVTDFFARANAHI